MNVAPRHRRIGLRVLLLAASLAALATAAAAADPEGWAYAYFDEVMSPFCPGRTLDSCPSGQADSLKMWILVQEAAGRTREDVHAELVERYGDVILSAPRAEGFGAAAYAIPAGIFLAGGLLVAVYLRRNTRSGAPAPAPASKPIDPEIERIIDAELQR